MMPSMICPWCEKEGKPRPRFDRWEDALKHLQQHGATNEQIEDAKKKWNDEIYAMNHPFDVYAGCSEWEAFDIDPSEYREYE